MGQYTVGQYTVGQYTVGQYTVGQSVSYCATVLLSYFRRYVLASN